METNINPIKKFKLIGSLRMIYENNAAKNGVSKLLNKLTSRIGRYFIETKYSANEKVLMIPTRIRKMISFL